MEVLSDVPIVLQTAGVVVIVLSFLLVGVNALLNAKIEPLKDNQARIESEQKEIKMEIREIKSEIKAEQKEIKAEQKEIKVEQKEIKAEIREIRVSLDRLIATAIK